MSLLPGAVVSCNGVIEFGVGSATSRIVGSGVRSGSGVGSVAVVGQG